MVTEVKTYRIICDKCGAAVEVTREDHQEILPYEWKFISGTEADVMCRRCWEKD